MIFQSISNQNRKRFDKIITLICRVQFVLLLVFLETQRIGKCVWKTVA